MLKNHYELKVNWEGKFYCSITLAWNYDQRCTDISMPGYVDNLLTQFEHKTPLRPQHSPHVTPPCMFDSDAQLPVPQDTQPTLSPNCIHRIQQVVGTIMYYAHAVDLTTLVALSSIAAEQTKATASTENKTHQLLDYLCTHTFLVQ